METNELPEDYGDDRRKDNILDSEKPPPRAVGVVTPDARQHTNTESYNELSDEAKEQIVKIAKTVTVDSANFEYIAKTGRINGGLWMDIQRVVADGYRLALQSKEEEIANLKEQAGFALEIESQMQLRIEQDIAEIEKRDKSWNSLKLKSDQQIKRLEAKIDSLTSEVERLKAERESRAEHKRLNDEMAQLTKPKEELTSEVERLREALSEAKELLIRSGTTDVEGTHFHQLSYELQSKIDSLLSQSTDKHQEKIAGRPEDFPWPVKEDKSLIQRIEERLGVVYLNDVYTWIQFKNALELESTDKP